MAVVLIALLLSPPQARAAAPDFLLRIPDGKTQAGSGAGEIDNPRGVAGDPASGRIYVSDAENARIDEYTAWGLFVKAWGWGVVDGAAELQTCGPAEPEAMPPAALCQSGIEGSGTGQFARPNGIEVDPAGNVYVLDRANLRVQKFSPAGEFLLMFGGEVNQTTKADVCTQEDVESGEECGKGTEGEGPSHLAGTVGAYISYSPSTGTIFVGDEDRIQEFNLDGTFKSQIGFEGTLEAFDGRTVAALDVDPCSGDIYFALSSNPPEEESVFRLDPGSGEIVDELDALYPGSIAVDALCNVHVVLKRYGDNDSKTINAQNEVIGFDSSGDPIPGMERAKAAPDGEFAKAQFGSPALEDITTIAANVCTGSGLPGNVYVARFSAGVSLVDAYGTPPIGCAAPPVRPPDIVAQYAVSVDRDEALLRAEVNPRFWSDTTYYVQYGAGKCSEGGCDKEQPLPPGSQLTGKVVNTPIRTAGVLLRGLSPDTTYHYRFVAQSSGSTGQLVEGAGGKPGEPGGEATFETSPLPDPPDSCPGNEALRSGPSARLPDCRAYELVSPLDKGGGDAALLPPTILFSRSRNQSATSGERLTYSSLTAFTDPESAPYISQYLADRDPDAGWSSEAIAPPRSAPVLRLLGGLINEFHGFSADLCLAWLSHNSASTLTDDAVPGYPNLYRRRNCGEPSYEALTTVQPSNRAAKDYFAILPQGFSADGSHSIFTADGKLHGDAPNLGEEELLLYERSGGELRFVCYLPNGKPSPQACSAGMAAGQGGGEKSSLRNAISADGSRIFWTAYPGPILSKFSHPGRIYVRIDGEDTIAVSEAVSPEPARYWTAADDGSRAIFEVVSGPQKGLYEFDVDKAIAEEPEAVTPIAKEVLAPMGASEDASRVYFASREALAAGASKGDNNLYLYEAGDGAEPGTFVFVMRLADRDLAGSVGLASVGVLPSQRAARVSPDGLHVAFASSVSPTPTGFDNLDVQSGEPTAQVYRYDAEERELLCVSCNPTGVRPAGVNLGGTETAAWAAARLQGWEYALHAPRVLSEDGARVFFESHEALVPHDSNGTWDVYQWEAPGEGGCEEGDASFGEAAGGCVDLISSGESPAGSRFLDADLDGEDVFLSIQSSLAGGDFGSNDVYDARVDGGFPEPERRAGCEGEACQNPPPPPPELTPASAAYEGPVDRRVAKPRCPKGKRRVVRRGKARCVRGRAKRGGRRADR